VAFRLPALLGGRPQLTLRARPASASPAVGSSKAHEQQQHRVVESAFAD
jgi:2-oxoglutarate dehydrogenase complex dehydrogenase (E1) component-like enzyme